MHVLHSILFMYFISLGTVAAAEFCTSTPCKHESSRLLLMMKHNADPCEEFHEFVCGGKSIIADTANLKHYHGVKKLLTVNATLATHLKIYKTFLESCEDYSPEFEYKENLRKLVTHRKDIGLTELLTKLILTQSSPLIDIGMDIDSNQNYQLQLTVPSVESRLKTTLTGWTVDDIGRKMCTEHVQSTITGTEIDIDEMYQAFKNCLREALEQYYEKFQKEVSYLKNTTSGIHSFSTDGLMEFLNELQGIRPPPNEIRQNHLYKSINPISISELKGKYDLVDWTKLFDSIVADRIISGNELVEIAFPTYFDALFSLLLKYDETTLVRLLTAYHAFQLYLSAVVPPSEESETYCFNIANEIMPAASTIIAHSLATKNSAIWNKKVQDLFEGLRRMFDKSLEESKLDDSSKRLLREKLKTISLISLTFENNDMMRNENVKFGNDFLTNLMEIIGQYRKSVFSLFGKQATPNSILTYFVNAFDGRPTTYYTSKFIVFHPSTIDRYSFDVPGYLVLAQLGMSLAKQLVQHFDRTGREYFTGPGISSSDQFYKYITDQTSTFVTNFFLKDSYGFMGITYSYQNVNITLLLNELLSDNAAFRLVHDYVKENIDFQSIPWASQTFSNDQLFFIAAAQQYCWETTGVSFTLDIMESRRLPSPLKIQNIVSNSAEFSEAFSCPEGSAMRLDDSVITQFPRVEYYGDYAEE